MRIRELLEGKNFKDSDWIDHNEDGETSLNYDLAEDLVFFMNNNDDVYRRHVYPSVAKCIDSLGSSQEIDPSIFKLAVGESYKSYVKEFPIRRLPSDIEDEVLEEACKKLHEEICKDYEEGKYKD